MSKMDEELKRMNMQIDEITKYYNSVLEKTNKEEAPEMNAELLKKYVNDFKTLRDGSITDYNNILLKFNDFLPEIRDKKTNESLEQLKHDLNNKTEVLYSKLLAELNKLKDEQLKLKYPNYKSGDPLLRSLGSDSIRDASVFLNNKQSIERFVNEIETNVELGRIDFASYIIESILKRDLDFSNAKEVEFHQVMESKKAQLFPELKDLESLTTDLNTLLLDIKNFSSLVSEGIFYYLPKSEVESMSKDELVNKFDDIQTSMKLWESL